MEERYRCVVAHTLPAGIGRFKSFESGTEYSRGEIAGVHGDVPPAYFEPVEEPAKGPPPDGPKGGKKSKEVKRDDN